MENKKKNKTSAVASTTQSSEPYVNVNVNYEELWNEMKNWKYHFNLSDLAAGIIFEALPTSYDILSDFILAEQWSNTDLHDPATATYIFLTIPGLVMGLKFLYNRVMVKYCTGKCMEHYLCRFMGFLILLFLIGLTIAGAIVSVFYFEVILPWKISAVTTSIFILFIKLMRLLFHGPQMKKLSVKISGVESQNESTFQLFLISTLILEGAVKPGTAEIQGIISSFIMIAKTGAENLLTFGATNKLENTTFWQKWKLLLKLIPVLTMITIFRVGTLFLCGGYALIGTAALPLIALFILKCYLPFLSTLTSMDMLQGVLAEVSTPSVWGTMGREKSRNIQLGMAICHLVVNAAFLITNIISAIAGFQLSIYNLLSIYFQPVAITALVCGLVSFPLYLYQIFWMEKYNVLQRLSVMATMETHHA